MSSGEIAYPARGTMTGWITRHQGALSFHAWGLEFGACSSLRTLAALREENRGHFLADPASSGLHRAKAELREVFCPKSGTWRQTVLSQAVDVVSRALQTLRER